MRSQRSDRLAGIDRRNAVHAPSLGRVAAHDGDAIKPEPGEQAGQDGLVTDVPVAIGADDQRPPMCHGPAPAVLRSLGTHEDLVRPECRSRLKAECGKPGLTRGEGEILAVQQHGPDAMAVDDLCRIEQPERDDGRPAVNAVMWTIARWEVVVVTTILPAGVIRRRASGVGDEMRRHGSDPPICVKQMRPSLAATLTEDAAIPEGMRSSTRTGVPDEEVTSCMVLPSAHSRTVLASSTPLPPSRSRRRVVMLAWRSVSRLVVEAGASRSIEINEPSAVTGPVPDRTSWSTPTSSPPWFTLSVRPVGTTASRPRAG